MNKVIFQQTISAVYQSYVVGVELELKEGETVEKGLIRAQREVHDFLGGLRKKSERFKQVNALSLKSLAEKYEEQREKSK